MLHSGQQEGLFPDFPGLTSHVRQLFSMGKDSDTIAQHQT